MWWKKNPMLFVTCIISGSVSVITKLKQQDNANKPTNYNTYEIYINVNRVSKS